MTKATVNYIETYFEYKELTKIHGEPTFETIKALHNQLKANASSVPLIFDGAQHGSRTKMSGILEMNAAHKFSVSTSQVDRDNSNGKDGHDWY